MNLYLCILLEGRLLVRQKKFTKPDIQIRVIGKEGDSINFTETIGRKILTAVIVQANEDVPGALVLRAHLDG
jgi:hypothetical protein